MEQMRPRSRAAFSVPIIIVSTVVAVACGASDSPEEPMAQPTEEEIQTATQLAPTVPLGISVNALMVSLLDHASHEIWDVQVTPPETDSDWQQLEYHAMQIVASGTLISMGGTGPADPGWAASPDWQEYAQQIRDVGTRAIGAVRSRSVEELESAGDSLAVTCEACHTDFKPDLPTEGLAHTPHYTH